MVIENFEPFVGQHCETTATGCLLNQLAMRFSEPMLFGLGEGLGYVYWNSKQMGFPFLGGRVKPMELTRKLATNLKLELEVLETSSVAKAWKQVSEVIDSGRIVGLQLDCFHLEYFAKKIHFAGHFLAMYGYDESHAHLVDTGQQGMRVKTSLKSLESARSEKGPMSAKNLMYTLRKSGKSFDMREAILSALSRNANVHLNPPIKNLGYKGILKTSVEIKKWFCDSVDIDNEFRTTAMIMEKAGTGGALFRNLYRDFLEESYEIVGLKSIREAHRAFVEIAPLWTQVSELFDKVGITRDVEYVNQASDLLVELSEREQDAMGKLVGVG